MLQATHINMEASDLSVAFFMEIIAYEPAKEKSCPVYYLGGKHLVINTLFLTALRDSCPVFHSHILQIVSPSLLNYALHDIRQKHYNKQSDP